MQERRAFYVIFAIAAALIVPAALTVRTVVHPVVLQPTSDNPTPLGYTWSLLLFIIPNGALGCWFCLSTRFAVSQKSVLANDRGANAARFPSRPVVWERVFRFPKQIGHS